MPPGSPLTLSRRYLLVTALVCWGGYVAIAALVLGGRAASFDAAGLRYFRTGADLVPWGPPLLIEGVRDWTVLGGTLLLNLCGTIAVAALLFARFTRRATVLAATMLSGWAFNTTIKALVARPRPTIVPHLTEAAGLSFPSGHSFNSATVYMSIALALASLSARQPVRWSMIAGAALVSAMIALSRVWLGVHYPSDAIAGWLGGTAWALTASALLYRPARTIADRAAPTIEAATPGQFSE